MMRRFDASVPPSGYVWWYLDALSDDGRWGLTLIAFIGSVFSPYYAWARRRGQGQADPADHCALNVALYAAPGHGPAHRWSMTERGRGALERDAQRLQIGPSSLRWDDEGLLVTIDEVTAPWPTRLRGTVRLRTGPVFDHGYALDAAGRHVWCPIAPVARVEVQMSQPQLNWQGSGYLDTNRGDRPLECDFRAWDWSRAALSGDRSAVLYDVERIDGSAYALAQAFDGQGRTEAFSPPSRSRLPVTAWRLPRATRCDAGGVARVLRTLEDGPFYARSVVQSQVLGEAVTAVHESLSMRRWCQPVVQMMLPFRMPRRA